MDANAKVDRPWDVDVMRQVAKERAAEVRAALGLVRDIDDIASLAADERDAGAALDKGTIAAVRKAYEAAVTDALEAVMLWRTARAEMDRAAEAQRRRP